MGSIITSYTHVPSSKTDDDPMNISIDTIEPTYPKTNTWSSQDHSSISDNWSHCNAVEVIQSVIDKIEEVNILSIEGDDIKTVVTLCMAEHEWIFFCTVCDKWLDLKACFDKPEVLSNTVLLQCINSWNTHRRFTRMTLDYENDLWLRADFPLSHQIIPCLQLSINDAIHAFGAAMLEYQSFIMTEASEWNVLQETVDIDAYTQIYKCTKKDEEEKCALCLENFNVNETCLRLRCGHMFHRTEIERYLYKVPKCPLCRSSIDFN